MQAVDTDPHNGAYVYFGDYHLGPNSPAIDNGILLAGMKYGLDSSPRDANPDMGTYEH